MECNNNYYSRNNILEIKMGERDLTDKCNLTYFTVLLN